MNQNPKTKAISKLLNLSIIFHAAYIVLEIILIAFQIPIITKILRLNGSFIFPTILFLFDIFRFLVHITLAILIMRQLKNNSKKRVLEIVSIILYGKLFGIIFSIGNPIFKQYISLKGMEYFGYYRALTGMIGLGSELYLIAFLLLIIACAMSWYYKKYVLLESINIEEDDT